LEVLIRLLNNRFSKDQLAKSADSVLARANRFLYGPVEYTDFEVVNPSQISDPVKARFHVKGKPIFVDTNSTRAKLAESLSSGLMVQLQNLYLLPPVRPKPDSNAKPEPSVIELKGPRSYSLNLNLTFTDLPTTDLSPPKDFHLAERFAEFNSRDSWEGATFHGFKSLDLRVATIAEGDLNDYEVFSRKIAEAFPAPLRPKTEAKVTVPPKSQPTAGKYLPAPEVQTIFTRGEDEYKRKNWANAIEAFGSATKTDPLYPDAWRELGRAQMYARHLPEAEAAFRRYLELAPNDHLAYLNMAWVLWDEKKFEEQRDLMLKRIAVAPDDGDALFRLGTAYMVLHQPEQAVPVLERSIVQFPKYILAHLWLARAYLETHKDLPAQASLREAVALDNSDNTLNSAAYLLADHGLFLDLAENWSQRSIDIVEKELNNSALATLQSSTWTFVNKLGRFWDTMGWIEFHIGKTEAAEKYILAAWQIGDDLTIGFHLARIYEMRGRKDDAIEMYLAALNTIPPSATLSDDAKEARKRLGDILGGDSHVDERLEQFRKKKPPMRVVTITNPGVQGIAQYAVIIDGSSKVVELSARNSDDSLANLNDAVRAASMPQSFPDTTLKKLPRLSTLSCAAADQPCIFTLLSASAASRFTPLD
jgi:tetratricopeptide (TPR) repeat protein